MNKKIFMVSTAIIMILVMLSACSSTMEVTCAVTVAEGPDKDKVHSQDFDMPKDSTALDLLEEYCNENGIHVVTTGDPKYVTGIGDVENTDNKAWIYTVNNEYVGTEPSQKTLENKDIVQWTFGDKTEMQDGGQS